MNTLLIIVVKKPNARNFLLSDTELFTVTGVDFTGALYVRNIDGSESKAYICLFTCATTSDSCSSPGMYKTH